MTRTNLVTGKKSYGLYKENKHLLYIYQLIIINPVPTYVIRGSKKIAKVSLLWYSFMVSKIKCSFAVHCSDFTAQRFTGSVESIKSYWLIRYLINILLFCSHISAHHVGMGQDHSYKRIQNKDVETV
jgi:hypothetical protein